MGYCNLNRGRSRVPQESLASLSLLDYLVGSDEAGQSRNVPCG